MQLQFQNGHALSCIADAMAVLQPAKDDARAALTAVSNSADESELHSQKHDSHKTSTDDVITINFNPLQQNADFSMR
jgi:hypothetical protein